MAARAGPGTLSPQGPMLSSHTTLEQQPSRLAVPMSPGSTIKIELPEKPRSLIEKSDVQDGNKSSGSGADLNVVAIPRTGGESRAGWFLPRLFNRRSRQAPDERELC